MCKFSLESDGDTVLIKCLATFTKQLFSITGLVDCDRWLFISYITRNSPRFSSNITGFSQFSVITNVLRGFFSVMINLSVKCYELLKNEFVPEFVDKINNAFCLKINLTASMS